jgi:hypothetical protein
MHVKAAGTTATYADGHLPTLRLDCVVQASVPLTGNRYVIDLLLDESSALGYRRLFRSTRPQPVRSGECLRWSTALRISWTNHIAQLKSATALA